MAKNKITSWIGTGLSVLMILSGLGSSVFAAEDSNSSTSLTASGMKFGLSADYYTKYIWRGQNLNNGSVFQPAVSISEYGFTASVWGSLDLTTKNHHSGEFTEFDYTLDYTAPVPVRDVNWVSFSVGSIYYDFPNTANKPTTEIYGGLNFDVPLSPYIKWYHDVQAINGNYVQVGVGHTIEKLYEFSNKCYCGLQIGSSIGCGNSRYDRGYFGVDSAKLNDWTSSIAFPFCVGTWIIRPSINYSTMLSDAIREATPKSDNLWFGVGISTSF